jgi:DNA-binding transcriptional ArsR family regulator
LNGGVNSLAEEIAEEAVVPDLETLRVLSDGRRHEILTALIREPLTVRALAERLRLPRTRLYYHLELLERHGLVRVVHTRMVSGALERTYRAAARSFRVDRGALADSSAAAAIDEAQATILHAVAEDLRVRRDVTRDPLVARTFVRLSAGRYAELEARLRSLMAEYRDDEDGTPAELALALFSLETV